jgi:hypothetical protein
LAQSIQFLDKAGLLPAVETAGFQRKDGAAFSFGTKRMSIEFAEKIAAGPGNTFQVQREKFDQILAQEAEKKGATFCYGQTVADIALHDTGALLTAQDCDGQIRKVGCRFVVDASGYGRVLPRLLDLDLPSSFPPRQALFTHVSDHLIDKDFDRSKILITIHPKEPDIWYWLIPFSNGTASVGVVAQPERIAEMSGTESEKLWTLLFEDAHLAHLLSDAKEIRPVGTLQGYSCAVKQMASHNFALLGNAGEFLDPVFSSGVTVALKSADLLIEPLLRQLNGKQVDWDQEFVKPLSVGVECFKAFVEAWYDGSLQQIIMNPSPKDELIRRHIVSVLAGYAWDENNIFVRNARKYLPMVAEQCG